MKRKSKPIGKRTINQYYQKENLTAHQHILLDSYLSKITKYNRHHRELNHGAEDYQTNLSGTNPIC